METLRRTTLHPSEEPIKCMAASSGSDDCVQSLDLSSPYNQLERVTCARNHFNVTSWLFRKALTAEVRVCVSLHLYKYIAIQLSVSKPIIDGELIEDYGETLLTNNSRVPIMIGVARSEWAHKKGLNN
jgi:hypothetical protein